MKQFKLLKYGRVITEDKYAHSNPSIMRNLQETCSEVTCRKPCYCSVCKAYIDKGEKALKTVQKVERRLYHPRYAYCGDCYQEVV